MPFQHTGTATESNEAGIRTRGRRLAWDAPAETCLRRRNVRLPGIICRRLQITAVLYVCLVYLKVGLDRARAVILRFARDSSPACSGMSHLSSASVDNGRDVSRSTGWTGSCTSMQGGAPVKVFRILPGVWKFTVLVMPSTSAPRSRPHRRARPGHPRRPTGRRPM